MVKTGIESGNIEDGQWVQKHPAKSNKGNDNREIQIYITDVQTIIINKTISENET